MFLYKYVQNPNARQGKIFREKVAISMARDGHRTRIAGNGHVEPQMLVLYLAISRSITWSRSRQPCWRAADPEFEIRAPSGAASGLLLCRKPSLSLPATQRLMWMLTQRNRCLVNKGFLCASLQRSSSHLIADKNRSGSNSTRVEVRVPGRENLLRNLGFIATWQFALVGASLLLVPQVYAKWAGAAAAGEMGATRLVAGANLTAALVMHNRSQSSDVSNGFGILAPFLVLDAYQIVSLVLARTTLSPLGYVLGGLKVAEAGVGIANWVQRMKAN